MGPAAFIGEPQKAAVRDTVGAVWCEVLQHSTRPGPSDNFFSSGGESLSMMLFLFRIHEELGVDLPPAIVMDARHFDDICAAVWKAFSSASPASGTPNG